MPRSSVTEELIGKAETPATGKTVHYEKVWAPIIAVAAAFIIFVIFVIALNAPTPSDADVTVSVVPMYLQAAKLYQDVQKYTSLGPLSHRTGSTELSNSMKWMQNRLKRAGATLVKREPAVQMSNAFVYNNDCNMTLKPVSCTGKFSCGGRASV